MSGTPYVRYFILSPIDRRRELHGGSCNHIYRSFISRKTNKPDCCFSSSLLMTQWCNIFETEKKKQEELKRKEQEEKRRIEEERRKQEEEKRRREEEARLERFRYNKRNRHRRDYYISFDETNIKVVDKAPTKYQYFFQHINNQSKEYNYSKEQDLFSPISRNFKLIKNNIINKRDSFENKVLNKLNEQKEFNNSYSEKDFKQNALKTKYPEYNRKKDHFNEKINNEFIENFKILKQKIKKQNNANDSIKNDIKRQQSLNKYKIQVGIVKLNEYKVKLRQLKKLNSNIY